MNYNALKDVENQEIPFYTVLKNLINKTDYINIACITKVHDENYVDAELYYKDSCGKKMEIQAVRLLHIGTTKCKINIVPAVGDNVLLLCPRDFIQKLEYHRQPEKKEFSSSPYGIINMCGILIREEGTDNVKTTITINENGDVSLTTEGNISASSEKKITFDGNKFGGLCKTQELKTQLDKATARIDGIIDALEKSATGSQDGGAAYKANITIALELLTDKEDYSNIESDKVLHGDNSGD